MGGQGSVPRRGEGVRAWGIGAALTCSILVGACDSSLDGRFLVERLSYEHVVREVEEGPVRLEIELLPDWGETLTREVERRRPHHLGDDERLETQVVSPGFAELVTTGDCRGTLAVALGAVEVRFGAGTRFEDARGARIGCIDFVSRLEAYIALGQEPQITAERRPPAVPQDPWDPVFVAHELRIDDEDGDGDQRPEIELNVTRANFATCAEAAVVPADCHGALRVLGMVVTVDGSTEVEGSDPEPRLEVRFGGLVQWVDAEGGRLRLQNGTVLRLVEGSELEWGMGSEVLTSLDDAQRAMGLGRMVEAHGRGVIVSTDPLVLWVAEMELEVERHRSRADFQDTVELSGEVVDADPAAAYVVLPFDTRLRVTEVSSVEGEFPGLDELGVAMGSGRRVRADARVVVEEIQRPVVVTRADRVTFVEDAFVAR